MDETEAEERSFLCLLLLFNGIPLSSIRTSGKTLRGASFLVISSSDVEYLLGLRLVEDTLGLVKVNYKEKITW